jgi:hypothetical protein
MDNSLDELARKAEQARSLDIARPSGAMIKHNHLDRQQEVVGVTRDDLEDILGFDGVAAFFGGLGVFLLSGAIWLIAENTFDADGFSIDTLMAFCISCGIFGAASLGAGLFFHAKKRGRIQRIFSQTKLISANNPSNPD